jgi:DNA-binding response OmpR family regulator
MPNGTARILLVDDEQSIQTLLSYPLRRDGYHVTSAQDGSEALQRFTEARFDLVILDLMLPKLDGVEVCRRLRSRSQVPIIMLTAKGSETDKVAGLEVGADDYITKPFDRRELIARIRSVLRRAGASRAAGPHQPGDGHVFRFGGWTLDLTRHELTSENAQRIELTTYEFLLLSALAQRPGQVLSRDRILDVIANRNWQPYDRSIDVLVGKLRRKLNDDPRSPRLIRTIRGIGYMLTPPANQG